MTSWRDDCGNLRGLRSSRTRWLALVATLLMSAFVACAHESPREGLRIYTDALRARNEDAVRSRSDARTRSLWATRGTVGEDWSALVAALDRKVVQTEARTRLHLDGGRVVELVREDGRWHVADGGLRVARADTPRAAFVTFMAAYDTGQLDILRALIPRRFLSAYASDTPLAKRLSVVAPRIEAARPALGVSRPAIEGDHAWIPYGRGRAVELILEDGAWRVLDLE